MVENMADEIINIINKSGSLLLSGSKNFQDELTLSIGDEDLSAFTEVEDLGVIIDSKLNFSRNIDSIISKANQQVYLIFKSFKTRAVKPLTVAFKTYFADVRILFVNLESVSVA